MKNFVLGLAAVLFFAVLVSAYSGDVSISNVFAGKVYSDDWSNVSLTLSQITDWVAFPDEAITNWANITGIPSDIADGDADTIYDDTNLWTNASDQQNKIQILNASFGTLDSTYANVVGDTFTGDVISRKNFNLTTININGSGGNGVKLSSSGKAVTLQSIGGGNNENIRIDFTNTDGVYISTSTGATYYWNMSQINLDDKSVYFGNSLDSNIGWKTGGNDFLGIVTMVNNAAYSGYITIGTSSSSANRTNMPLTANPTLRIWSGSPTTGNNQYLDLYHDNANTRINSGKGEIVLGSAVNKTKVLGSVVGTGDGNFTRVFDNGVRVLTSETDSAHDTCAEISGCVENALPETAGCLTFTTGGKICSNSTETWMEAP